MDFKKIGQRIKMCRRRAKLTQKELAQKIGKTESSIRKYEGDLIRPPMDVIEDIAAALGVEPVELLNAKLESPNVKTSTAPDSSEIMNFTRTLIEQQQNMIDSLQKTVDSQQERIQQLEELVQTYEKSLSKSKSRAVGSAGSGICTN